MSTQLMPVGLLGRNVPEGRPRSTEQSEAQKYLQNLSGDTPLVLQLAEANQSLFGDEALTKIAQFAHVTFLRIDATPWISALQGWTWPVIEEIDTLRAGREDEVVPTEYAYKNARSIIESTYGEISSPRSKKRRSVPEIFPEPLVTTDDVGGIRLSWRTEAGQVRANFGATPELRSYVYFESGLEHDVEPLDPQHLAGRLTWLTGR
jgi:hypothetical protein